MNNAHNQNSDDPIVARQQHQQQLTDLSAFQATGSLSYITDKTKYYGRFLINQTSANQYQLKLTSPLGSTIFSLMVTPYMAELTDKDGNKYTDQNVERLMVKLTGMDIPFSSLHNWFKGLSNNPQLDKYDSKGLLTQTTLIQDSQQWQLLINRYHTYKNRNKNIELPTSIQLTNKQDQLKITINDWKIN